MSDPQYMVRGLDMRDDGDRGLVRKTTDPKRAKRWRVPEDFKDEAVAALRNALQMELARDRPDARAVRGIVDTLAKLEGQNQADEHLEDKNRRLDEGRATEAVEHYVVEMPKPRRIGSTQTEAGD